MVQTTAPPSAEWKYAEFWKRVRGFGRKLVTRRTLMIAFWIVLWATRVIKLLRQMYGGF